MNFAELRETWVTIADQMFDLYGQESSIEGISYISIVDSLPFSSSQRSSGGGLEPDFQGSIFFKKADYNSDHHKVGKKVTIGPRLIRIVEVSGKDDDLDSFITCKYEPITR